MTPSAVEPARSSRVSSNAAPSRRRTRTSPRSADAPQPSGHAGVRSTAPRPSCRPSPRPQIPSSDPSGLDTPCRASICCHTWTQPHPSRTSTGMPPTRPTSRSSRSNCVPSVALVRGLAREGSFNRCSTTAISGGASADRHRAAPGHDHPAVRSSHRSQGRTGSSRATSAATARLVAQTGLREYPG